MLSGILLFFLLLILNPQVPRIFAQSHTVLKHAGPRSVKVHHFRPVAKRGLRSALAVLVHVYKALVSVSSIIRTSSVFMIAEALNVDEETHRSLAVSPYRFH